MDPFPSLILSPGFFGLTRLHVWYKFELNVDKQGMGNLTFSLL